MGTTFSERSGIATIEPLRRDPRFSIAQNLAKALDVPVEYFYSRDDQTAELLLHWHKLSKTT